MTWLGVVIRAGLCCVRNPAKMALSLVFAVNSSDMADRSVDFDLGASDH